ncbi:MAG: extracellular solute-binding protein, partial [Pseudomonadota bacterium]|nr:extracellular solute-binding protein [Pseudomonadota bacterium]
MFLSSKKFLFAFSLLIIVFQAVMFPAYADSPRHALSLFGDPKYKPGFAHFDYVNPNAPKRGEVREAAYGSFDSFNPYILKGTPAQGLGLIYDTLTASSLDEPGTQYALLAKSISHPDDYSSVTFTLDERARFHDGVPVKAADVVWSFETLTTNHPFYRAYYADVESVVAISENIVKFTFRKSGNRELPQIVGQLVVLPKHYWMGESKDIQKTTLEPPIGSGPYIIDKFETGRFVTYRRNPDYWAKNINVSVGKYNFARVRYDYFGDFTVAFEAFKAGELHFRNENNSKNWATGYDVPAVKHGK